MTDLDNAAAMVAFDYLDDGPFCMVLLNYPEMTVARINNTCARCLAPARKMLNVDFLSLVEEAGGPEHRDKLRAMIDSVVAATTTTTTTMNGSAAVPEAGGGGPVRARARNIEMITLRDDESGFPVKRHFDWTAGHCKENEDFSRQQILLFGDPCSDDDIEQRAKDLELIDFFQNAPIAMHWLSGEGKVLWANQTELSVLGYTEAEYFGQPIMKFCPDEEELVLEIFKQLGSGNTIRDVPVRFRAKDGHVVDLLIDSNVKYDAQGNFAHTRCFIRDDTKRKIHEAKAALLLDETKRSLKMMDHFMSRSMHHMRTPLHILRYSADLVLDQLAGIIKVLQNQALMPLADQQATIAELVHVSSNILTRSEVHVDSAVSMIDDISDLARLDQGQQLILSREPVVLPQLLSELIGSVDVLCNIKTSVTMESSAPRIILSDGPSLRKVLQHLLEHLASVAKSKHTAAGQPGEITLRVFNSERSGNRCCFETVHTRPAMVVGYHMMEVESDGETTAASSLSSESASGLPAIFQRYHQEFIPESTLDWDRATSLRDKIEAGIVSHRDNSIGIGLSLSYHIVSALGGDLRYRFDPVQGQTKFWFSLPAPSHEVLDTQKPAKRDLVLEEPSKRRRIIEDDADDAKPAAIPYSQSAVASCGVSATDPPTVLVVEDTAVCAKLLCRKLNKINIATKWVVNGQEAIDLLKSSEGTGIFDLIIMDLRMPVMDGFEATKIIKEEMKLAIPVVALTGETGEEVKKQCADTGFDEMKQKPMKMDELIDIVKHHTGYVSS